MASNPAAIERPTLHIQRIFDAPRSRLWAAWATPEMLVRWFGPEHCPAVSATSDFRIGGRWSAILQPATGDRLLDVSGVYLEIVPEQRLVFSFKWGDGHVDGTPVETIVTITLSDRPAGRTQLDFAHADLKSAQSLEGHRYGWTSAFGRLDILVAGVRHGGPRFGTPLLNISPDLLR